MNKTSTRKKANTSINNNKDSELSEIFVEAPDSKVIDRILNYSKALSIKSSSKIKEVEVVLN